MFVVHFLFPVSRLLTVLGEHSFSFVAGGGVFRPLNRHSRLAPYVEGRDNDNRPLPILGSGHALSFKLGNAQAPALSFAQPVRTLIRESDRGARNSQQAECLCSGRANPRAI